MTDQELTKLCADAMGYTNYRYRPAADPKYHCATVEEVGAPYWPLRDDAQAMALVKKLGLTIDPQEDDPPFNWRVVVSTDGDWDAAIFAEGTDLNRAIVECASKRVTATTGDRDG